MTPLLRKLLGMNWLLIGCMIALSIFGVIAVYSASYFRTDEYWRKLQGYARLWADEQRQRGRGTFAGRGLLAAVAYLLKNVVLRGGVVDGRQGLRFHWLHARYAKLKYDLLASAA